LEKVIIYDSDHPGAMQNKCFAKEYATLGPGHGFSVMLAEMARQRNFEIVTGDVFLGRPNMSPRKVFCITEMYSKNTNKLLRIGAVPLICFSTESPIIARTFYINIKRLAGRFIHNIQFKGTSDRLAKTSTQFSVMYIPIDHRVPLSYSNWKSRELLVLINRNKRMFYNGSGIKDRIRSVLSKIKIDFQKMVDPWIRSKEIYKDRVEAIYHFSKLNGFHLYGQGWENSIPGFPARFHLAAKKSFKGAINPNAKLDVMNRYKFALCFENCIFPGYVTEKIFDCFLSACIPVYYGAPDIEDFVPPEAFIDYRKFKDFDELEHYLLSLSEQDSFNMLESARRFLASKDFDKYETRKIVEKIFERIASYEKTLSEA
jgi:hypothetical protein